MAYKIIWTDSGKNSYFDEIDFILQKWNLNEVYKFEKLIDKSLDLLSNYVHIATYSNEIKLQRLVISKQTTLYFDLNRNNIELLLFWNNQKDPNVLLKILKGFQF